MHVALLLLLLFFHPLLLHYCYTTALHCTQITQKESSRGGNKKGETSGE